MSKNGHQTYQLWYTDPVTEKRRWKSTGTTDRNEAERAAGAWQAELADRPVDDSRITWQDFRDRFRAEHLAHVAAKTAAAYETALNQFEAAIDPARLLSVTPDTLSRFAAQARQTGLASTSIQTYLRHLRAALRWAVDVQLLTEAPRCPRLARERRSHTMRGRPVTEADLAAMQAAVATVFPAGVQPWQDYIAALYLSGLRLRESLILSWSPRSDFAIVEHDARLYYRIFAAGQKNRTDQLLPIAPEFADWLGSHRTPGRVFSLPGRRGRPLRTPNRIGDAVSAIATAAGLEISAHDFRRAFGTRWAQRVNPFILQQLMRHKSITTTRAYYVSIDAAEIASQLDSKVNVPVNCSSAALATPSSSATKKPLHSNGLEAEGTGVEPATGKAGI